VSLECINYTQIFAGKAKNEERKTKMEPSILDLGFGICDFGFEILNFGTSERWNVGTLER
jgi:hypothetical protein